MFSRLYFAQMEGTRATFVKTGSIILNLTSTYNNSGQVPNLLITCSILIE
ncbi:MAG: hypothetical protein ABFD61_06075 [Chloroherpetonaceae bacterium]